jgi:hypothetical protein
MRNSFSYVRSLTLNLMVAEDVSGRYYASAMNIVSSISTIPLG